MRWSTGTINVLGANSQEFIEEISVWNSVGECRAAERGAASMSWAALKTETPMAIKTKERIEQSTNSTAITASATTIYDNDSDNINNKLATKYKCSRLPKQ